MTPLKKLEVWFVTGSQSLYGEHTLNQVAEHSREIAGFLNDSEQIPVTVIYKPILKSAEEITSLCSEANEKQELYRGHNLDAHIFSCEDVDHRIENTS